MNLYTTLGFEPIARLADNIHAVRMRRIGPDSGETRNRAAPTP